MQSSVFFRTVVGFTTEMDELMTAVWIHSLVSRAA